MRRARTGRSGITKLQFRAYLAPDGEPWDARYLLVIEIATMPTATWKAREERSVNSGWEAQYTDDGRGVVAMRLLPRRHHSGRTPWKGSVAVLRRLRGIVLRAMEAEDQVSYVSMQDDGDGPAEFNVSVRGLEANGFIWMAFGNEETPDPL
jgi:hypothetical protein